MRGIGLQHEADLVQHLSGLLALCDEVFALREASLKTLRGLSGLVELAGELLQLLVVRLTRQREVLVCLRQSPASAVQGCFAVSQVLRQRADLADEARAEMAERSQAQPSGVSGD